MKKFRTSQGHLQRPAALAGALLTAALTLLVSLDGRALVYENVFEFTSTADVDGDGDEDLVIVDKATGNYRVAYQQPNGQYSWTKARASGVSPVTGFTVGRLLVNNRDALAFTGPDANRLNLLSADNPNLAGLPLSVFPSAIGPSLAVALDVGGANNTALDDLFIGSVENGGATPNQLSLLRNNAATFSPLGASVSVADRLSAGNAFRVKTGTSRLAAAILRGNGSDTFRGYDLSGGTLLIALQLGGLTTNAQYVAANFNGGALAQFLFYQPDEPSGALRLRSVIEPTPGSLTFASEVVFSLGAPIQQLFVLPQGGGGKLLVVFGHGESARVYTFDGINAPVAAQDLTPESGERFSGVAPLANGNFTMLSAGAGSNTSTRFRNYNFNGSQYVGGPSGALPAETALSASANVLEFQSEPFVSSSPTLLRTVNAGDWSTALNVAALPQLSVLVESFVDGASGLDNPTTQNLGLANPLTHYGLVNQYAAPLSLFSFAKPVGEEVAEVKIAPPAGTFDSSIQVTLTTTPGNQIFYRTSASAGWTAYSGPVKLFSDTTVSYYAKPALGNNKSVIRHATYHFTTPPATLDSDNDGVPDYVEIAKGLNPKAGPDTDGDGYSDLEELVRGTNPNDKSDAPINQPRVELKSAIDFVETPRPLDGVLNVMTVSAMQTPLHLWDVAGALLGYSATENLNVPGALNPACRLSNVVVNTHQRLLALATESHFNIATPGTNKTIGRELLALRPVSEVSGGLSVPYQYGGGNLATEAQNWIAGAQAAASGITHETVVEEMGIYDTLIAVLVEKKISDLLVSRGQSFATNLTLFPFRSTDQGRSSLSSAALLSLEALGPNGEPAYQIRGLYQAATNRISPVSALNAPLRALTTEIYRLSSASNEVIALPSPVDALRQFLLTGQLHSNYLASTTLGVADLAQAYQAATQILAEMQSRPTTNLTLLVRADTFISECVLLDAPNGGGTWSLFSASGAPFHLLDNFSLPIGSQIQVLGFTDLSSQGCAGQPLEVIGISLASVPAVSGTDSDGDLLPDDLELLLFGNLSQNGFGDADGDGISNLQEFLDGTDLKDGLSKGANMVNVDPPQIELNVIGGQLKISWDWPDAYANKIQFVVLSASSVGDSFVPVPVTPVNLGGGHFEAQLFNPNASAQFYKVKLSLK